MKRSIFPRYMTLGEKTRIFADFRNTFFEVSTVTSDELFMWATNCSIFYEFFYPRFEENCRNAIKLGYFEKYDPSYKPQFLEWAPWEIKPTVYSDFVRGLMNSSRIKPGSESEFGKRLYAHYLKKFKEENQK